MNAGDARGAHPRDLKHRPHEGVEEQIAHWLLDRRVFRSADMTYDCALATIAREATSSILGRRPLWNSQQICAPVVRDATLLGAFRLSRSGRPGSSRVMAETVRLGASATRGLGIVTRLLSGAGNATAGAAVTAAPGFC
jgi:hypothetical protein